MFIIKKGCLLLLPHIVPCSTCHQTTSSAFLYMYTLKQLDVINSLFVLFFIPFFNVFFIIIFS